ncbi:MAG: glutamine synthetase [Alphaproteobacteria bacterium]|nr:glutamine synthetase [Alphaproteobacteria bacterium]MBV8409111.1 glutamine synthetase [Alphaproteobacteria bacterium]
MDPRQVKTAADARAIVKERGLTHVKVGVHDLDGVLRGKYLHVDKFDGALDGGMGFCDVVLGWDIGDQLYDNVSFTGWHTAYPDATVRILPETCREIATEPGNLLFLCEFAGSAEALCPRGVLRRVLKRAADLGFEARVGFEYEFFVFAETAHTIRDKGYRNLRPISPGFFGYSMLRNSVQSDWYRDLLAMCETMDMGIEGLHTETGAGVLEAALRVRDGLTAADNAALFKLYTKVLAQKRDWLATFMAKWSKDWPGCGGHMHLSLWQKGEPGFYDAEDGQGLSAALRHFVGGQQTLMPELLAMVASNVNSYRRLIPGFWAPTAASWGIENRTTSLRVIRGSPKSTRVEYRVAAADANPYLALAAAVGSGIWGIENEIEPGEPVQGNSYDKKHPAKAQLPRTLMEAAGWLKASKAARALFGDAFVDHYSATREWEEREFRKAITEWELDRYMEII